LLVSRAMHPAVAEPASAEWSPEVAERVAQRAALVLGPLHWSVLGCAREIWASTGRAPSLAVIARCTGIPTSDLVTLFSTDTEAVIRRVAGIPTG
jgi:sulfur relay (sulfurtransferase) DsrC/TusE family protein